MEHTEFVSEQNAVLQRYLAIWNVSDDAQRRAAVAELWSGDGVEFVDGTRFEGRASLAERVREAHEAFIASGVYVVGWDEDLSVHDDMLRFTIHLADPAQQGESAWAARVFLLLDDDGLVQQSYQLVIKPLPTE
ncbi:hypothetical protein [Actinospica robiniae]|uniref:hypothetical protein n=1 Tax=Actinospica robiniae TaxID=304901 RepID=UPI00041D1FD0|nr:hypothetical protein [Actinospica robiniae]